MDSFLKCICCKNDFNLEELSPCILPCNHTICTKCIHGAKQLLGGYLIECRCLQRVHKLASINDLYPCEMIINYLKSRQDNVGSIEGLKKQLELSWFSLEVAKYEANKHYDAMEMNIDIRAESLIELIHEKQEQLHRDVKERRRCTEQEFEDIAEKHSEDTKCLEAEIDKFLTSSQIDELEPSADILQRIRDISKEFNRIQRTLEMVKNNIWYFSENGDELDATLLGKLLNKSFEANYFKVKNLDGSLKESASHHRITLQTSFREERLRQYIMPLNRNRIVSVYFTSKRCIYFELFNQKGELINSLQVSENVSYYPILSNTSNKFIICYIAQPKSGSSREPFSESVSHLRLYDENLNCIRATKERHLVESIFMNDRRVVCSFTHKSVDCCKVYDIELNELKSFGQQTNVDDPFYFEKLPANRKDYKARLNPSIFGYTSSNIYLHDRHSMLIMCQKTGRIVHSARQKFEGAKYLLDEQNNVIEANITCKEVDFYNTSVGVSARGTYDIEASDVFLLENYFLAFVDVKKQSVIIV